MMDLTDYMRCHLLGILLNALLVAHTHSKNGTDAELMDSIEILICLMSTHFARLD